MPKPVVVSMGDVAASGGYYIACPADAILALPATVTGSIGVLGGKFVVAELLERLGLTTGTVQQGDRALMYSARRRFGDHERERLAATIDAVYADFVGKVAAGRGRSTQEIEAVARGRVERPGRLGDRAGRPARRVAGGSRRSAYARRPARRCTGPAGRSRADARSARSAAEQ